MKSPLIVLFLCVASLAQSRQPDAPPQGVPAGATSVDGATWRWVDKAGKAWMYRASPFGMLRSEEVVIVPGKRPAGVPEDAKPLPNGVWRWVDTNQKAWLYQETRNGLLKVEETDSAGPFAGPNAKRVDNGADYVLDLMTVKEEGDSLRFTRPGPFGTYSWVKKKTLLDRDETIVWQREQAKASAVKKD